MIPRELIEGVSKMLETGAPREVVRQFLLERGWNESEADEVFAQIDGEAPTPKPAAIPPQASIEPTPKAKAPKPREVLGEASRAPRPTEDKKAIATVEPSAPAHVEQPQKPEPDESSLRSQDDTHDTTELFEMDRLSSPFTLTTLAFSLVRARFWSLFFLSFMISVLLLLIYIVGSYVITPDSIDAIRAFVLQTESAVALRTTLVVLGSIVLTYIGLGLLFWLPAAFLTGFANTKASFRELFIDGFRGGFALCMSLVFLLLFSISGLILLLVPGIIFAVWFSFAPIIAVLERVSPYRALIMSRELVRGHFWQVVWREAFLLIPATLFVAPLMLLLSPLAMIDSLSIGLGALVLIFCIFGALLLTFAFLLFLFAYKAVSYKEMRARIRPSERPRRLVVLLPLSLLPLLVIALSVAMYASSLI